MNFDPSGHSLLAILGMLAVTSLLTWGASALFDQHLVSGVGLGITGASALVTGIMAFGLLTPVGMVVGGITALAGIATLLFASAELQQGITGENWMLNSIDQSLYTGLMITSSTIASIGAMASGVTYKYQLKQVAKVGRIDGLLKSGKHIDGHPGIRFKSKTGKFYSIEIHPFHHKHGIHLQFNQWYTTYPKFPGDFVLKPLWRL